MGDEAIESTWSEEGIKSWSDSKLQANINSCELSLELGTGDDYLDWEHSYALGAFLLEQERRGS